MKQVTRRRPSGAMVVAIIALVVAASGTAVAAKKLVSGDTLIIKGSLSGNRLRKHTVTATQIRKGSLTGKLLQKHTLTGSQINLARLGTVPSATNANNATVATTAASALNANNASNAAELNGLPGSSYLTASNRIGAGRIVTGSAPSSTTVFTSGPFTLTMSCANTHLTLIASSAASGSIVDGQPVSTGGISLTSWQVNSSTPWQNGVIDFEAPNGASAVVTGAAGINNLAGFDCWADFAGIR